jgi:2-succinyl-5-enolpyruvyl-6-hydroxy-3-cyclohexene-1-carboxylate synthase
MNAPNVNYFMAGLVIDELARRRITEYCLSPGSRSAPLAIAAAGHPDCRVQIITDERASAFHAAGYARACGRAAAIVCTSGTAVANFLPAVVEAYHSRLPLVLLTADRPEELQNCGANQTIDQEHIFGKFTLADVTIPAPTRDTDPYHILQVLKHALDAGATGPVHINVRFREPLAPVEEPFDQESMRARATAWYQQQAGEQQSTLPVSSSLVEETASLVSRCRKGLLIAGPQAPFRACRRIADLSMTRHWPLLVDILSQLRYHSGGGRIAHFDLFLDDESICETLRPDMIIHVGGVPTSKRLNQFLLRQKGVRYIKIQDHNRTIDPDHLETDRVVAPPDEFLSAVMTSLPSPQDDAYLTGWLRMENGAAEFMTGYCSHDEISETSLAYHLGKMVDDGQALFLGNSMPVRDADTFMSGRSKDVIIGCNRGASGIDGILASACGFATGSGRPTTLVTGDLSLLHDATSLALARQSDIPITIIIINNNGGGIFHFLPVAQYANHFEKCFAAPHGMTFDKAAAWFDLPYFHPRTMSEFRSCYQQVRSERQSAVIEITCDRGGNVLDHERLRAGLRRALFA